MSREIVMYRTNSKFCKVSHLIYGKSTPGTYSDYLLMKEDLKLKDPDYELENQAWYKRVQFSTIFLTKVNDIFGSIRCAFCGQDNLKIYNHDDDQKRKSNIATSDHFIPLVKGGLRFSESNLVPACSKCNVKKGEKILDISALKYLRYDPNQPAEWIVYIEPDGSKNPSYEY